MFRYVLAYPLSPSGGLFASEGIVRFFATPTGRRPDCGVKAIQLFRAGRPDCIVKPLSAVSRYALPPPLLPLDGLIVK